jgi:radical SAM superfamily enzyme YgiQ (UPF0313 family)
MKILLINPPILDSKVYARYSSGAPCLPPLGLCYLASVLLKKNHEVKILDCVAEKINISLLLDKIGDIHPSLVGVTSATVSYAASKVVLQAIKKMYPDITTVLGGAHISALPAQTMADCEAIDVGVFGPGEYTLMEIVERLDKNQSLINIQGALLRYNGRIVENRPRDQLVSIDEIPLPARHLLKDLRLYSHTPFRGGKFMTTMITSRGCPFNCAYCDQSVFGRVWKYHSPDYVISEMAHLKEKYGINFISIEDDNFLLSKKRTIDICKKIIDNSINLSWSCLGRVNEVDDNVLPLLKKAGCKTIYIGIESGSSRVLELINKKISIEDVRKGVELIKKYNINVTGSFILGLPTETKKDIEKTIELALSLPLDGITFFTFTPYPKTPLRDLAFQHGKVSKEWKNYSGHPSSIPFIPNGMDEEYLLEIQAEAYRKFLLRPKYLLSHFATFANRKVFRNGLGFLKALVFK